MACSPYVTPSTTVTLVLEFFHLFLEFVVDFFHAAQFYLQLLNLSELNGYLIPVILVKKVDFLDKILYEKTKKSR